MNCVELALFEKDNASKCGMIRFVSVEINRIRFVYIGVTVIGP